MLALALLAATAASAWLDGTAAAQSPPTGRISGTIHNGTPGATLSGGLEIRLLTLDGNSVTDSQASAAVDGHFTFAVDPSARLTHVLRALYQDVSYFADAVTLSPDAPAAERDITVFETTAEAPALSIAVTTVTVIALDRAAGELTLLREDAVRNPGDRVYVGDATGVTFRVPAFDGVTDAGGLVDDGSVRYEAGVVTAAIPLVPGETSIVTRYVVQYDRAADRYRLRATAPIPADRIEARIPARFVLSVDPVATTRRDGESTLQGERVLVLAQDGAAPGEGLLVDLVGLSGVARARNPLTEQPGAAIAAALALATLAAGAIAIGGSRARDAAP